MTPMTKIKSLKGLAILLVGFRHQKLTLMMIGSQLYTNYGKDRTSTVLIIYNKFFLWQPRMTLKTTIFKIINSLSSLK